MSLDNNDRFQPVAFWYAGDRLAGAFLQELSPLVTLPNGNETEVRLGMRHVTCVTAYYNFEE